MRRRRISGSQTDDEPATDTILKSKEGQTSIQVSMLSGSVERFDSDRALNTRAQTHETQNGQLTCYRNILIFIIFLVALSLALSVYCIVGITGLRKQLLNFQDQASQQGSYQNALQQMADANKRALEQAAIGNVVGLKPVRAVSNADTPKKAPQAKEVVPVSTNMSWHDSSCSLRCTRADFMRKPLIVISLDGFARDYLDKGIVKALERMASCGSSAKFMYSTFPSRTFPNHYSIATGLFTEAHGIVDNYIHDPDHSDKLLYAPLVRNETFYKGQPIWTVAEKSGLRTACLFWFGCDQHIQGGSPTYNLEYNRNLPYKARVDKIIEWLSYDVAKRPALIMAYFDQPDTIGHFRTNNAEVDNALVNLEDLLNYLFSSLHSKGFLDCVNVIIVSDHGMKEITTRLYLDQMMNTAGMLVSSGVIARIELSNSLSSLDDVKEQLRCNGTHYRIYDRRTMPRRFHYSHSRRIGDLVLQGQPGITFLRTPDLPSTINADHGYDYLDKSMHAIFFARGPSIAPNVLLEPFQNIELFNLFQDLLEIPNPVSNNGTCGVLRRALARPRDNRIRANSSRNCADTNIPMQVMSCGAACESTAKKISVQLNSCLSSIPTDFIGYSKAAAEFCFAPLCAVTIGIPSRKSGQSTFVYEPVSKSSYGSLDFANGYMSKAECAIAYSENTAFVCAELNKGFTGSSFEKTQRYGILSVANSHFNLLDLIQFPLYTNFIEGPFMQLQALTYRYAQKYDRLIAITGSIFDFDEGYPKDSSQTSDPSPLPAGMPSHIFRILMRCEDNQWSADGHRCQDPYQSRVISFILPNLDETINCLDPMEYLRENTARIRDIELLTGLEFFSGDNYNFDNVVQLRTHIPQTLWNS